LKILPILLLLLLPAVLVLSGCSTGEPILDSSSETELADELLILDTHMDSPMLVNHSGGEFTLAESPGHFNYEKARQGGLNAAFMAVYISPSMREEGGAFALANEMIDQIEDSISRNPDKFAAALTEEDIRGNFQKQLISLPMGIENGSALEEKLENIEYFYDRGIRYITLTHSRANGICDSSFDDEKVWKGLSPFGKEVVAEMNRLGMMIDVSHASDDAFFQILELSEAPVLATHSSCRHFVPGLERNMSDEMIVKLAEKGGVMQINFCASFLDADYAAAYDEVSNKFRAFLQEENLGWRDDKAVAYREKLQQENSLPEVPLSRVVDHIEHVISLVGDNHVGLGSDFDGIGDAVPVGLEDVSKYRDLVKEMSSRGLSREVIEKVCGGNFLRLWKEVEQKRAARNS
jgi:membrane dipeptidase